jgi:hypothetical protein
MTKIVEVLSKVETFKDAVLNNKGTNYNIVRDKLKLNAKKLASLNEGKYLTNDEVHALTWLLIDAIDPKDENDGWK